MENLIQKTTQLALHILSGYVQPGDTVIDATCGNGQDSLRLAQMQPDALYAFDIQPEAVANTLAYLRRAGFGEKLDAGAFQVICAGHESMGRFFQGREAFARGIIFNLGYLPGGDKSITTSAATTLAAVQAAMVLLAEDGLLCLTMYSGHPAGAAEKEALLSFARSLDAGRWHVSYIQMMNQIHHPPEILLITKKSRAAR